MNFASDNTGPAHPAILAALAAANDGYVPSYGNDALTAQVQDRLRAVFEAPEAQVFLVPTGTAFEQAMQLAQRVATNAPLTNYALTHVLPRIADQPADQGFITESMMSAIAQAAPEAKQRVRDFLEGRAAKVSKQ